MNRFDRALAILLLLRSGKTLSAPDLAKRLGVSVRTIYRDVETLSQVGVPVYAEIGREGGFRLTEGYFLPPIAFTVGEATSLLTGLALLDRLRAKPFAAELDTATHKLLAVVPDSLRRVLSHVQQVIGFEAIPDDIFHPERTRSSSPDMVLASSDKQREAQAITIFLKCIFEKQTVVLDYRSPYRSAAYHETAIPYGIVWDRDLWYLVGCRTEEREKQRLWRADRVLHIEPHGPQDEREELFNVQTLLNRQWLDGAMVEWAQMSPVVIHMTHAQADQLQRDWYYAHAQYEVISDTTTRMTFGESTQSFAFALLRWLGPGAELIEPHAWRESFVEEARQMLRVYEEK